MLYRRIYVLYVDTALVNIQLKPINKGLDRYALYQTLYFMVPGAGIEPAQPLRTEGF